MVQKELENHQRVAHASTTLERIRLVKAGKRLAGRHGVFGAAYRLLQSGEPAPTVTRSGFRDFIHPRQNRFLTVRELARLQTFPDSYVFKGRRCDTYAKSRYVKQTQHEQIGNAVPPALADHVARSIRKQLFENVDVPDLKRRRGLFLNAYPKLAGAFAKDSLGNKSNPLDELIYIMLSRRTREDQYRRGYKELARAFRPWSKLLKAPAKRLKATLQPLGLVAQRVKALCDVLKTIKDDFGGLTLAPLRRMGFSSAYHYLRSLPGVNDKTAKCVMFYSLGLPALPVDSHTYRVSKRLGLLPSSSSLFRARSLLEAVVPRQKRGPYHVLTLQLGRSYCTARNPKCRECPLSKICVTGRRTAECRHAKLAHRALERSGR